jgi:hypothetical protein
MRLLALVCGEGATERRREGWIADGVPAVGVATVVVREDVALVLAARTQGAQEGTPDSLASMHLVVSRMLSAGHCITSGHDAPSACRMLFADGLWSRSAATCGATAGGPGCCSSARPCGSATPACPAIVAAPHRSSHGQHAVQRSCDCSRCMNNANIKSASHACGCASRHLLQRLGSVDVRLWHESPLNGPSSSSARRTSRSPQRAAWRARPSPLQGRPSPS